MTIFLYSNRTFKDVTQLLPYVITMTYLKMLNVSHCKLNFLLQALVKTSPVSVSD